MLMGTRKCSHLSILFLQLYYESSFQLDISSNFITSMSDKIEKLFCECNNFEN